MLWHTVQAPHEGSRLQNRNTSGSSVLPRAAGMSGAEQTGFRVLHAENEMHKALRKQRRQKPVSWFALKSGEKLYYADMGSGPDTLIILPSEPSPV